MNTSEQLLAWLDKLALNELLAALSAAVDRADQMTMHHLLGQSVFDIEGDDAWGETFFVMHAVSGGPVGRTMTSFGRYVDYFRRIDEQWKLVYRRVVPDVTLPGDDAKYWTPTRGRADPRYDRLTKPPGRP